MTAEPTVDARWACLVADLLEAKQIEPEGLLRQAGLSRRQVSDPDRRIPFRKHAVCSSWRPRRVRSRTSV